eukprot:m.126261 g.126261  ORF g.126261 m.126261 type:complete len:250 (-) comp15637_c0_seq4:564-1313(-)
MTNGKSAKNAIRGRQFQRCMITGCRVVLASPPNMPRQKRAKKQHPAIHRVTKSVAQLLSNVHRFFQEEKSKGYRMTTGDVLQRTAIATGVSRSAVCNVLKKLEEKAEDACPSDDEPETRNRSSTVPEHILPSIRGLIHKLYEEKQLPTLNVLLARMKEWTGDSLAEFHNPVLVLDHATYHRTLTPTSKPAKSTWKKAEFAQWLVEHNISFEGKSTALELSTLKRSHLYQLCKDNAPQPEYEIECKITLH